MRALRRHVSGVVPVSRAFAFLTLLVFLCIQAVPAIAQNHEQTKAGVVKIESTVDEMRKTGTGIVVKVEAEDVFIVTASHVVKGDKHPKVFFHGRRVTGVNAEVLKSEGANRDGLALLVVRGKANYPKDVRALSLAQDESLEGGDEVIAIGFGQGQGEWGVIRGGVSSVDGRSIKVDGRIEEGNSGGPLLKDAQVVGVLTDVVQGFGIATPTFMVSRILKRWGVELSAPDARTETTAPPIPSTASAARPRAADATPTRRTTGKYSLVPMAIAPGRKVHEEGQFDVRNATLIISVAGQQIQGSAANTSKHVIERETLAANGRRIDQERIHFVALESTTTRTIGADTETESSPNTLNGRAVVATRMGSSWKFDAVTPLTAVEIKDLLGYVTGEEEGYPNAPVAVGYTWEVTGPALRIVLNFGDHATYEGRALLRFERVVPCEKQQCAEISIAFNATALTMSDDGLPSRVNLEGAGHTLRVFDSDINAQTQLSGQATIRGTLMGQVSPIEMVMSGPFSFSSRVAVQ